MAWMINEPQSTKAWRQGGRAEVRAGALCFPDPDGLPLVSGLKVREVVIDGPKRIAKFTRPSRPAGL